MSPWAAPFVEGEDSEEPVTPQRREPMLQWLLNQAAERRTDAVRHRNRAGHRSILAVSAFVWSSSTLPYRLVALAISLLAISLALFEFIMAKIEERLSRI